MLALVPVGVLAVLVTVLVAGARSETPAAGTAGAQGSATAGQAAPFTLPDLRHSDRQVAFTGSPERPTVVNFFGAWCVPCREELPLLAAEAKARGGVDFIGVDVRDVKSDALRLLDETGVTFPTGFDPRSDVVRRYDAVGMPATFFIAPGGRIVASHHGPISRSELRKQLDRLEAA